MPGRQPRRKQHVGEVQVSLNKSWQNRAVTGVNHNVSRRIASFKTNDLPFPD
jgi:hypothetical protein